MTHGSEPTPIPALERFVVRQKLTMMVNRYEVIAVDATGTETGLLCLAQQKRMAFKEQVTFYADESRSRPVFSFKARTRMDLGATYDVTDAAGTPIGWFRKDFAKSLLRSTWHLGTPDGFEGTGRERNQTVAVLRRFWELVPLLGDIPVPWLFHFDFTAADGTVVMSSVKRAAFRDVYRIELPAAPTGWRLDWRVAAAMAVALDALQSR
ncbi:MAG: hypothetical protein JNL54_07705 [Kineosporiaceae bacterium]|nr:hypothetical protein [Kineosporiaceae bacterium]